MHNRMIKNNISHYLFLLSIGVLLSSVVVLSILIFMKSNKDTNVFSAVSNAVDQASNNNKSLSSYEKANITINGFSLIADVPVTIDEFQKGLDIKNQINENQAMLFIFKEQGKMPFWMHGMKFPIDIIWFDNNSNVVHIEHNLQPCKTDLACPSYSPENNALYVLETRMGFSERHNVKIGTHMNFNLIK